MIGKKLVNYIKANLSKGNFLEQIKQSLLASGSNHNVGEANNLVQQESFQSTVSTPLVHEDSTKKSSKFRIIFVLIIVAIIVGVFAFFISSNFSKDFTKKETITGKCNFNRKIGEFNLLGVQELSPSYLMLDPNTLIIQAAYDQTTDKEFKHVMIQLYKFDSKDKANEFYNKYYETKSSAAPCNFENVDGKCAFETKGSIYGGIPGFVIQFIWKENNIIKDIRVESTLKKWSSGMGSTQEKRDEAIEIFNEYTNPSQEERQNLIRPFISMLKDCEPIKL